ncbi:MAG: hypothetical protein KAR06_01410 [Deltaproteobacteria bacterium]|nr:hypothetical protein [Deltaproteobacteria bacterium]
MAITITDEDLNGIEVKNPQGIRRPLRMDEIISGNKKEGAIYLRYHQAYFWGGYNNSKGTVYRPHWIIQMLDGSGAGSGDTKREALEALKRSIKYRVENE